MPSLPRKASSEIRTLLADNVKRLRQLRGLTQHSLALHCGYTKSYIGNIELATQNVTLRHWKLLPTGWDVRRSNCSSRLLVPLPRVSLTLHCAGNRALVFKVA